VPAAGIVGRDLSTNFSIHDVCPGSSLGALVVLVVGCAGGLWGDPAAGAPPSPQALKTNNAIALHAIA
jgi:hypothetical protein